MPGTFLGLAEMCRNGPGGMLTALFSCSLAGDEEGGVGFVGAGRQVESEGHVDEGEVVVEVLLNVGKVMTERGVVLLACQKCIHPMLMDYLHQQVRFMLP